MASASDFTAWAQQDLVIPFRGRTYSVRPPSVKDASILLACAVRGEVNLGIVDGPIPEGVQRVLDTIKTKHPALGDVYDQMVTDGVDPVSIDRFGYYATFYWARGEEYADTLARILFTPRVTDDLFDEDDEDDEDGDEAPKAS